MSGSPPHVRGKDRLWQKRFHEVGITPACAGKRRAQDRQDPPRGDHPRMCGEKNASMVQENCQLGSPPHVRGKVDEEHIAEGRIRITPAYAGKRVRCSQQALPRTDHPRMCGEKYKIKKRYPLEMGSPPHVRGKEYLGGGRYHVNRITPACAGKRCASAHALALAWDHPRMCGEKNKE